MEGASLIVHNHKQSQGNPEAAFAWTEGGAMILEVKVEEEN